MTIHTFFQRSEIEISDAVSHLIVARRLLELAVTLRGVPLLIT